MCVEIRCAIVNVYRTYRQWNRLRKRVSLHCQMHFTLSITNHKKAIRIRSTLSDIYKGIYKNDLIIFLSNRCNGKLMNWRCQLLVSNLKNKQIHIEASFLKDSLSLYCCNTWRLFIHVYIWFHTSYMALQKEKVVQGRLVSASVDWMSSCGRQKSEGNCINQANWIYEQKNFEKDLIFFFHLETISRLILVENNFTHLNPHGRRISFANFESSTEVARLVDCSNDWVIDNDRSKMNLVEL